MFRGRPFAIGGWRWARLALVLAAFSFGARAQERHVPVVLISVDGLKPEYVLQADAHHLQIPNLRRFPREGSFAEGVRGVVPTVTYPSHTTLITGASPARHGIYANTTFDPQQKNRGGWYWYAEDIRVPTLWDAVAEAHLTTANVHWPVSVAERHITWNLPQYWRAGTPDDRKLLRVLATPGLLDDLEKELGPYADGMDEEIGGDENRARFAARLMEWKRPDFMTVYLTALDTAEHQFGPFSAEANATLERIDAALGRVVEAAERVYKGQAIICVVSDHGFAGVSRDVNLGVALRQAGLMNLSEKGEVTGWKGAVWSSGGSAAIVLRDSADATTKSRVSALLQQIAANRANGIDRIVPAEELRERGGFPNAQFLVALRPGFEIGEALTGKLITDSGSKGTHGYWPDIPEMRSSFFIAGPGIAAGRSLGTIDMRSIAPTLARLLGVRLPAAEAEPIELDR
jgi:predicted AlkP superfamily pyrophosphatase or phosphodiesterase